MKQLCVLKANIQACILSLPHGSDIFKSLLIGHIATFVWFLSKHHWHVLGIVTSRHLHVPPTWAPSAEISIKLICWDKNQTSGSTQMATMRQQWTWSQSTNVLLKASDFCLYKPPVDIWSKSIAVSLPYLFWPPLRFDSFADKKQVLHQSSASSLTESSCQEKKSQS